MPRFLILSMAVGVGVVVFDGVSSTAEAGGGQAGLTPIAAEDTSVTRGPDVDLGEHWYGPECSWEHLKGKVVLFVELVSVT